MLQKLQKLRFIADYWEWCVGVEVRRVETMWDGFVVELMLVMRVISMFGGKWCGACAYRYAWSDEIGLIGFDA